MAVEAQNISRERLRRLSAHESQQKCCGFDSRVWRCFVALSNVSFLGARTSSSIIKATFTETTWTIFSSPVVSLEQHLYSAKNKCIMF